MKPNHNHPIPDNPTSGSASDQQSNDATSATVKPTHSNSNGHNRKTVSKTTSNGNNGHANQTLGRLLSSGYNINHIFKTKNVKYPPSHAMASLKGSAPVLPPRAIHSSSFEGMANDLLHDNSGQMDVKEEEPGAPSEMSKMQKPLKRLQKYKLDKACAKLLRTGNFNSHVKIKVNLKQLKLSEIERLVLKKMITAGPHLKQILDCQKSLPAGAESNDQKRTGNGKINDNEITTMESNKLQKAPDSTSATNQNDHGRGQHFRKSGNLDIRWTSMREKRPGTPPPMPMKRVGSNETHFGSHKKAKPDLDDATARNTVLNGKFHPAQAKITQEDTALKGGRENGSVVRANSSSDAVPQEDDSNGLKENAAPDHTHPTQSKSSTKERAPARGTKRPRRHHRKPDLCRKKGHGHHKKSQSEMAVKNNKKISTKKRNSSAREDFYTKTFEIPKSERELRSHKSKPRNDMNGDASNVNVKRDRDTERESIDDRRLASNVLAALPGYKSGNWDHFKIPLKSKESREKTSESSDNIPKGSPDVPATDAADKEKPAHGPADAIIKSRQVTSLLPENRVVDVEENEGQGHEYLEVSETYFTSEEIPFAMEQSVEITDGAGTHETVEGVFVECQVSGALFPTATDLLEWNEDENEMTGQTEDDDPLADNTESIVETARDEMFNTIAKVLNVSPSNIRQIRRALPVPDDQLTFLIGKVVEEGGLYPDYVVNFNRCSGAISRCNEELEQKILATVTSNTSKNPKAETFSIRLASTSAQEPEEAMAEFDSLLTIDPALLAAIGLTEKKTNNARDRTYCGRSERNEHVGTEKGSCAPPNHAAGIDTSAVGVDNNGEEEEGIAKSDDDMEGVTSPDTPEIITLSSDDNNSDSGLSEECETSLELMQSTPNSSSKEKDPLELMAEENDKPIRDKSPDTVDLVSESEVSNSLSAEDAQDCEDIPAPPALIEETTHGVGDDPETEGSMHSDSESSERTMPLLEVQVHHPSGEIMSAATLNSVQASAPAPGPSRVSVIVCNQQRPEYPVLQIPELLNQDGTRQTTEAQVKFWRAFEDSDAGTSANARVEEIEDPEARIPFKKRRVARLTSQASPDGAGTSTSASGTTVTSPSPDAYD